MLEIIRTALIDANLQKVATETGLSVRTLYRIRGNMNYEPTHNSIMTLMNYFGYEISIRDRKNGINKNE